MDIDKFDYLKEFFGQDEIKRLQKCIAEVLEANMQDDELFADKTQNISLLKYTIKKNWQI